MFVNSSNLGQFKRYVAGYAHKMLALLLFASWSETSAEQ